MSERTLEVANIVAETPLIRRIVLRAPDGAVLAGFGAGAHVTIHVPDVGHRKYSLVNVEARPNATQAPYVYTLGIRLDAQGEGGSRYMHGLAHGDRVTVSGPANDFALDAAETPVFLLGGGIGITPLLSMAAEMTATGRPHRVLYAARSRSDMAFLDVLEAMAGERLTLHADDTAGRLLDIEALLASLPAETQVYACGPKPMLKAAVTASRKLGWPAKRLKFELFYSVANAPR